MYCDLCGGGLILLGVLGNTAHMRCRDCGWHVSADAEAVIDQEPGYESEDDEEEEN